MREEEGQVPQSHNTPNTSKAKEKRLVYDPDTRTIKEVDRDTYQDAPLPLTKRDLCH